MTTPPPPPAPRPRESALLAAGSSGAKTLGSVAYCYVTNAPEALRVKIAAIQSFLTILQEGWAQLGGSSALHNISWACSRG